jgi:hypothetical protein
MIYALNPNSFVPDQIEPRYPNLQCRYCKALFWHGERVGGLRGNRNIIYNNCCKGGKVFIPPYKPRPKSLASLSTFDGNALSKRFMKNIRQYNYLFAFTSMGAHIDSSVNDGRSPPIFKICGQVHHHICSLRVDTISVLNHIG